MKKAVKVNFVLGFDGKFNMNTEFSLPMEVTANGHWTRREFWETIIWAINVAEDHKADMVDMQPMGRWAKTYSDHNIRCRLENNTWNVCYSDRIGEHVLIKTFPTNIF